MLENNLKQINKYNPTLVNNIIKLAISGKFEFDSANSNDPIMIYNDLPLHSYEDPQKEAIDIFKQSVNTDYSSIHVLFGIGLGYLFKRYYLDSRGRIIIFEPNLDILRITLESVEFSAELADSRVFVVSTTEELTDILNKIYIFRDPIDLNFLPSYKVLYSTDIENIADFLSTVTHFIDKDYATLFLQSREWLDSSLGNLRNVLKSHYIGSLKDKFKGVPAVIVASGPSLQKNIAQLVEHKDKFLIFSVGSALRLLKEEYNITPHFSIYIDVRQRQEVLLKGIQNFSNINFIVQPSTYNGIYNINCKRRFIYLPKNDAFSEWLGGQLKLDISRFENKGTVSITAFQSALFFGCEPIILLGQDMAYSSTGEIYADKTITDFYISDKPIKLPGWGGGQVISTPSLASFRESFIDQARAVAKSRRLINSTEGGAYINGFEHIPFYQAIESFRNPEKSIDETVKNAILQYTDPLSKGRNAITRGIEGNYKALERLKIVIKNNEKTIEKLEKVIETPDLSKIELLKAFQQLGQVNTTLDNVLNDNCPFMLAYTQQENYQIFQKFLRFERMETVDDLKLFLSLCKAYYKAILNNIPELSGLLEKVLKELKDESSHTKS